MAETLKRVWKRPTLIILCSVEPEQSGTQWDFKGGEVLYLTDDNREAVSVTPERIENRRRMIDGTMRSYFVADKKSFSTSWKIIPSRSIDAQRTYISEYDRTNNTSQFGAGIDIKNWYESHTGDFWALFVYDSEVSSNIENQAELYHVFFNSFDYAIEKRGQYNDLWSVSISLVEA